MRGFDRFFDVDIHTQEMNGMIIERHRLGFFPKNCCSHLAP